MNQKSLQHDRYVQWRTTLLGRCGSVFAEKRINKCNKSHTWLKYDYGTECVVVTANSGRVFSCFEYVFPKTSRGNLCWSWLQFSSISRNQNPEFTFLYCILVFFKKNVRRQMARNSCRRLTVSLKSISWLSSPSTSDVYNNKWCFLIIFL